MADPGAGQNGTPLPPPSSDEPPCPSASLGTAPTRPSADPATATVSTSSSSGSRYIPQFSAATQMILKRMKSESSMAAGTPGVKSMSPQPETKSEMKSGFNASTYEDVRRRVIMGMSTSSSMTLQMPAPAPRPAATQITHTVRPLAPSRPPLPVVSRQPARAGTRPKMAPEAAGLSPIRRVIMGFTASGHFAVLGPTPPGGEPAPEVKEKKPSKLTVAPKASKRKPGRTPKTKIQEDDTSSLSELTDLSDIENLAVDQEATPTTTTKSGRQVQKPSTYNPAAMDSSSGKKRVYSKVRTTEQALCKLCTRMASPDWNQIVFCDGCNDPWHQQCHDPWIADDVVRDASKTWYCATCQAKKEHQTSSKKQRVNAAVATHSVPTKVGWASAPPQQKRAYLSTLPQQELVALIMGALEVHPDLPIFPGEAAVSARATVPPQKEAKKPNGASSAPVAAREEVEEESDELTRAWPKPGLGPFNAQLTKFMAENPDKQEDHESFSHALYQGGRKTWENGV